MIEFQYFRNTDNEIIGVRCIYPEIDFIGNFMYNPEKGLVVTIAPDYMPYVIDYDYTPTGKDDNRRKVLREKVVKSMAFRYYLKEGIKNGVKISDIDRNVIINNLPARTAQEYIMIMCGISEELEK